MDEPVYKAGDIYLVAGEGFFARGIRYFTRDRKEAPTRATHGGLIVFGGRADQALVVEALSQGVVERPVSEAFGKQTVAVFRPLNLSDIALGEGILWARQNVGRRYGWLKIAAQVLDWAIPFRPGGHHVYFFRRIAGFDRFPFCTFLVDGCIRRMLATDGFVKLDPFGVPHNCCTPDDIDDFVHEHVDKYSAVVDWPGPLTSSARTA